MSKRVFGSDDNVVPAFCVQLDKESRVPGYPDDEITIEIRILLSVPHCFRDDDIVLRIHTAGVHVSSGHIADGLMHVFYSTVAGRNRRIRRRPFNSTIR